MSQRDLMPAVFTPMLATAVVLPFDSDEFLFEVKWDGVRTLAFCEPGRTRLFSRSKREVTHQYPEFTHLHELLKCETAVLDGEIVALDTAGKPSFERMQQRIGLTRPSDVRRGTETVALDFVVFDLVFRDGDWLGSRPLQERLSSLVGSVDFGGRVLPSQTVPSSGIALFEAAAARDLEGIVGKRVTSTYMPGKRSKDWLKIKVVHTLDCVIGGWTPGAGYRSGAMGALLLGVQAEDGLRYIGNVGTGFTDRSLADVHSQLKAIETQASPFSELISGKNNHWVSPEMVCEVEYREITSGFRLRAPSFKRLRSDKSASDCHLSQELGRS
ncbi:MAG: non-homologous end-joining DNA ligase [Actinomycetota bacterium]